MRARELIKSGRAAVTINGDDSISEAMKRMLEEGIGSLIVVNRDDNPIGIITESDIFRLTYRLQGRIMDLPIRDHMSSDLILGVLDDEIEFIAEVMINNDIQHVPIMDENQKLCGIISIRDIVKAGNKTPSSERKATANSR